MKIKVKESSLDSMGNKEFGDKLKSLDQAFGKPMGKAGRIEEITVDKGPGSIVVKFDSADASAECNIAVYEALTEGELRREHGHVRNYWCCKEYFTLCSHGDLDKILEFVKKVAATL